MTGKTLAHYQVAEKLGAGGMGEVYRARDSRLGRDVAIKVLPSAFAKDSERLARFEREARLLAALNHPNIATIYGFEHVGDVPFLVLEYVPGPTLAEQLAGGGLHVETWLQICSQVAHALEAAHEKGIVHRDLKPANIKVTPDGTVKVLDFGLAKALADESAEGDPTRSPTLTAAATRAGVIMGTAAYMSPEQARGRQLDKRTDIWSFGCVLYETLAGRQAFGGDNVTDIIAAIVRGEPDWNALPASTPGGITRLLRRCLQKEPKQRLHDIADARIEIEEALTAPAAATQTVSAPAVVLPPPVARRGRLLAIAAAVALVAAAASGLGVWWLMHPKPASVTRLTISLPPGDNLALGAEPAVAISPDGTRIVYTVARGLSKQLYMRAIDRFDATPIPGTEGGHTPFFSADGQWIGFFGGSKLKKVSVAGGPPVVICDAITPRGAAWGPDDTIVFPSIPVAPLLRVSAAGGAPQPLTTIDRKKGEISHRWPQFLPGGKAILFTILAGTGGDQSRIGVQELGKSQYAVVLEGGSYARYAPTGHLLFVRSGSLLAVPFDLDRLRVTGGPVPVVEGVLVQRATAGANYAFSTGGTLVYVTGGAQGNERNLVSVNRDGSMQPVSDARRDFFDPRVSPDGRRLAIVIASATNQDIWIHEPDRNAFTRMTFEGLNYMPFWSPDGKRIAFVAARGGPLNLFWKAADGTGPDERLLTYDNPQLLSSWSPDGRFLAFSQVGSQSGADVHVLALEGERKSRPFVQTPFDEYGAAFSPDGRWLAYFSNESGRPEVYVQPFPGPGAKIQVSTEGGEWPLWAPDGKDLFYRSGDKMMAAAITTQPAFRSSKPRMLFEGRYESNLWPSRSFDITPDGRRFVMLKAEQQAVPRQINVVLNWFEDLKARAGSPKR